MKNKIEQPIYNIPLGKVYTGGYDKYTQSLVTVKHSKDLIPWVSGWSCIRSISDLGHTVIIYHGKGRGISDINFAIIQNRFQKKIIATDVDDKLINDLRCK